MFPLLEMLKTFSQDDLQKRFANQFGIDPQQAQSAIESLMPAFSEGLKRQVSSPNGFANLLQALADGHHANYMSNPMAAFSSQGMQEGNAILGHLFGDKEISRAVAKQAEATSGVSEAILKKMLPALAPMVLGGLYQQMAEAPRPKQTSNAGYAQGAMGGGGIFGQILEQMMGGGAPAGPTSSTGRRNSGPSGNPLEQILEQMTGGLSGKRSSGGKTSSTAEDRLGDIFNDMLRHGPMGGFRPDAGKSDDFRREENSGYRSETDDRRPKMQDPYGRERDADTHRPTGGLEDLFGDMFNPYKQKAPQYEKAIEDIFDQFMGKRRR